MGISDTENNIRFNFRLTKSLFDSLEKLSKTNGTTKSALIRTWINDTRFENLDVNLANRGNSKTYNLFLSDSEIKTISQFAGIYGVTKSTLIQNLIQKKISVKPIKQNHSNIIQLWNTGEFKNIIYLAEENIDKLTEREKFLFISACLELGHVSKFEKYCDSLDKESGYYNLCIAYRYIYKKDLNRVWQELQSYLALENSKKTIHKEGIFYKILAKYYLYKVDLENTKINAQNSLNFLHKSGDITSYLSCNIFLLKYYSYTLNWENFNKTLNHAKKVAFENSNIYYLKLLEYEELVRQYILDTGSTDNINSKINNLLQFYIQENSIKEQVSVYELLAISLILKRKQAQAYSVVKRSEKLEKLMGNHEGLSYSLFFKELLLSNYDYNSSVDEMRSRIKYSHNRGYKSQMCEVLLNATEFIRRDVSVVQDAARKALINVSENGLYPLIQISSKHILESKRLQPVR